MRLSIDTDSYNERRYGHPWIAKVDFANSAKGEFTWGDWCGQKGQAGTLYLDVTVGDIVARGQKDNRRTRNSSPDYYIVQDNGTLGDIVTKADAYKHWQQRGDKPNPLADVSITDLLAEIALRGYQVTKKEDTTQ